MKRRNFLASILGGAAALLGGRWAKASGPNFRQLNLKCRELPATVIPGPFADVDVDGGYIVPPQIARELIAKMNDKRPRPVLFGKTRVVQWTDRETGLPL